ncbi:MAG: CPBP family intramembrane metalloprotease [Chloroflexaceae bacterium]|jgi:hypothetical protein|nr:CPBP family intramembrane metalloprotease [Chloroflexaceae bacterium]
MQNDGSSTPLPWRWRDVLWAILLVVGGGAALVLGARALVQLAGISPGTGLASPLLYVMGVGVYVLMMVGVYLFAARKGGWASLGVRPAPTAAMWVAVPLCLLGMLLGGMINIAIAALSGRDFENPQVNALTGGQAFTLPQLVLVFLLIAVLVPVAEELLFRGMIYPLLRQRWGVALAVLANAAIFAVFHVIPVLFPSLFVAGLFLALLRETSKSIVPCILYHGVQNGLALILINAALAGA